MPRIIVHPIVACQDYRFAEIVHDIDLKDSKFQREQKTSGIARLMDWPDDRNAAANQIEDHDEHSHDENSDYPGHRRKETPQKVNSDTVSGSDFTERNYFYDEYTDYTETNLTKHPKAPDQKAPYEALRGRISLHARTEDL
jgi:hypothetical protein